MRFGVLHVRCASVPAHLLAYLVRSRHAFQGAILDIDFNYGCKSDSQPWHVLSRLLSVSGISGRYDLLVDYNQPRCWNFISQLADGVTGSHISAALYLELQVRNFVWFPLFEDMCFFFRLPFVRRYSIVRIYGDNIDNLGTRSIIDWLFDDANNSHCRPSRHLQVHDSKLVAALKEEVSEALVGGLAMELRSLAQKLPKFFSQHLKS